METQIAKPIPKSKHTDPLRGVRASGRVLLRAVFLFSIFVNLLMLTGPLFMLQVYDRVLGSGSEATLVALFALVVGLYGLMAVLDYARGRVLARYGARFQAQLDEPVFNISLKEATDPKNRGRMDPGLRSVETLQQLFNSPALLAICDVPWTPLYLFLIFIFHPALGWLAVCGAVLLITLTILNHILSSQKTLEAQTASSTALSTAEVIRKNADLVLSQGMAPSLTRRWLHLRERGLLRTIGASDVTGLFSALTKSLRLLLQSAMLALGAYLVLQFELTAGAMIAGSILLGRALAPIEQLIGYWPLVQKSSDGWRHLDTRLTSYRDAVERTPLPEPEPKLALTKVTVMIPNRTAPILKEIDFTVSPGEAIGIIGRSGAGKSSLARVLLGLMPPTTGHVRLGGAHLTQYEPEILGRYIGYLPQSVTLFPGSIAENIARMEETPDSEAVIAAAKKARVHDLIVQMPDGYDTLLGADDTALSGGQVQRVGLARALYSDPLVLVLDEPNSALDAEGTEAMNVCIRDLKSRGRCVVLMTHRPMAIAECDRLIILDNGQVRANGPRDKVLSSMVKNADEVKQMVSKRTQ
ncbi:MAG: type I secretion system permease/ATPase [Pseudomonadota bacterium]